MTVRATVCAPVCVFAKVHALAYMQITFTLEKSCAEATQTHKRILTNNNDSIVAGRVVWWQCSEVAGEQARPLRATAGKYKVEK